MKTKECNCIEDATERIKKHLSERKTNPKGFKIIEAGFEHRYWYPENKIYANFVAKSTFEKKDGTTSIPKNENISITFTYCPFCGKKYDVKQNP